MKQESYDLFKNADTRTILRILENELEKRNESPFWKDKVVPFSEAILSVLIPLRDADMLFDPQGAYKNELTPELFFEWSDFVSLKTLAFILQRSNEAGVLLRTDLNEAKAGLYKSMDLNVLGS